MPVYEFLCGDCNRVFNFLARTPAAAKRKPRCPQCGGRRMSKLISRFAMKSGSRKSSAPDEGAGPGSEHDMSPAEEARMERELMKMASEMESMDENDPRQMAAAMRRLSDMTGEQLEPEMQEMIRRLEAGEDPEKVEEDMADVLGDDPMGGGGGMPSHDGGLYEM